MAAWPRPSRCTRSEMPKVMRLAKIGRWLSGAILAAAAMSALVPCARADYLVLQSGQSFHVTSYERIGATLRLTMQGGTLEIPADALLRVDPEATFTPVKVKL